MQLSMYGKVDSAFRICFSIKLYFLQCNNTNHTKLWALKVSIVLEFYVYANSIFMSSQGSVLFNTCVIRSLLQSPQKSFLPSRLWFKLIQPCSCRVRWPKLEKEPQICKFVVILLFLLSNHSDSFSFSFSISFCFLYEKIWNRISR